jgi:hypothetical protein
MRYSRFPKFESVVPGCSAEVAGEGVKHAAVTPTTDDPLLLFAYGQRDEDFDR